MKKSRINLNQLVLSYLLGISLLAIGIVGGIWFYSEYNNFRHTIAKYEEDYFKEKQNTLIQEVGKALDYIEFMKARTEDRLQGTLKNRTYEAHAIAFNLYENNKNRLPISEIERLVKEALRPIRFNNGRGCYFATRLDGVEELSADKPEMEGRNLLAMKDAEGRYIIRDMIELAKNNNEGFYRYTWAKPTEKDQDFPKIAFIKYFKPFNWFIGTVADLDEVTQDMQHEVIERIEQIRFGRDGYIFAGTMDGVSLAGPASAKGKNMWEVTDPNGVKIVQELIKVAEEGGGFVHYTMPQFEGIKNAPKLSYATSIKEWGWYIGAGIYVGEIKSIIAEEKRHLQKRLKNYLIGIFLILITLAIGIIVIGKIVSLRIKKNFDQFTRFFTSAATQHTKIDTSLLNISDFVNLAQSANLMIDSLAQNQKILLENEARFRLVMDSLNSLVYVADMETYEILFINEYGKKIFGDITGATCWKSLQEGQSGPCSFCTNKFLVDENGSIGDFYTWEFQNTVSGQWYYIHDKAITWLDGRTVRIEIATDITERKQAEKEKASLEKQLRQAYKMEAIGTMAGGIAHDFNNILAIILGNAEMAKYDLPTGNNARHNIDQVIKASTRAKDLVKQILTFSRQSEQQFLPIQPCPIIKESLKLLRSTTPTTVSIVQNVCNDNCTIIADATQIHQLLMNLFSNAVHAMDEKGTLEVIVDLIDVSTGDVKKHSDLTPGKHLRIKVTDTGKGIDKESQERIFDPFYTTKDVDEGTGMGLSIVLGIVKNHKGCIEVDSALHEGTTFTIYFPVIEDVGGNETSYPVEANLTGNERILFVDDEEMLADMEQKILERQGYQVMATTSSNYALETFKSTPDAFDLVITDQSMPNMSGSELSEELLKIRPDIPIILCTGFSKKISEENAKEHGIKAFCTKPLGRRTFLTTVRKVLDDK